MDELEFFSTKKLKRKEKQADAMKEAPIVSYAKPKHKLQDDAISATKMLGVATYKTLVKGAELYKKANEDGKKKVKKKENGLKDLLKRGVEWYE